MRHSQTILIRYSNSTNNTTTTHLVGQLLAELHTPLVERVQPPHEALDRSAVLVDGQELASRKGVELREEKGQRRPVSREHLGRDSREAAGRGEGGGWPILYFSATLTW